MSNRDNVVPSYRLHKQSGQAIVTLNGRDVLLGKHATAASREKYNRVIGEWMAGGRQLPRPESNDLTITELVKLFWDHVKVYYRKPDGTPSAEQLKLRLVLGREGPLRPLYGRAAAISFGPLALKAVRAEMIRRGWCRTTVNAHVGKIKMMFRWATESELLPASVYHALQAVAGLKLGRSEAAESEPILPVPQPFIDAVMPWLTPTVKGMIELQLLTGMRPGEVVEMRSADVDMSGRLWTYKPDSHKTAHHGHDRVIYIGPRAQEVLRPFLKPEIHAYLFSPAESKVFARERRAAARKTPLSCGNVPGRAKRNPRRRPGAKYTVATYRRAIARACDRADKWAKGGRVIGNDDRMIERWHPHQLRHNAATALRKDYGLEAAQVILGHKTLTVTQVYAEKNVEAARRIMSEVG